MPEPVRLVIWDLDETFWKGTITEGGIQFIAANRDIVIELARRGIMSSICSKNDFDAVKQILTQWDVWDYFVFPSIEWTPKGPRIQSLVDTVQLRPETILFVDDNPANLKEAQHFLPKLQISDETIIPDILANPLFRGKNDNSLSRLKQYKNLEKRKADEVAAGADVADFLRSCNIQVRLEFDIEPHIDRVVELINRTNQLNFTKKRLPEDPVEARAQALRDFKQYQIQAALVHVSDRYGDHGYCGFYAHNSGARSLQHFCFSCRILGMGVEQWLYEKLNRPSISVRGEVLCDLADHSRTIDWINRATATATIRINDNLKSFPFTAVTARGSCDLAAVIHYFMATVEDAIGEYFVFRAGGTFRIDHSIFLRHAIKGVSAEALEAAKKLGFIDGDFQTRLFSKRLGQHLVLLSFAADMLHALYRHRTSGLLITFPISVGEARKDVRLRDWDDFHDHQNMIFWRDALQYLKREFDYIGCTDENLFKENLGLILGNFGVSTRVFILEALDHNHSQDDKRVLSNPFYARYNRWIRDVAENFPNVTVFKTSDFIHDPSDLIDMFHFDRKVYFRMFERLYKSCIDGKNDGDERVLNRVPDNYLLKNRSHV